MTGPVQVGELLPSILQEVIDRAGAGYDRWMEQVGATGCCAHPVRLRGRVEHADRQTGEVRGVYSTDREPDATLLKACGNRRGLGLPLLLRDLPGRPVPPAGGRPTGWEGRP
jgi:hypothetical protein